MLNWSIQKFFLGQLVIAANSPKNIDDYTCERNEVKLITPLYNMSNNAFLGLTAKLAYILLKGGKEEGVFSYGFDEKKLQLLHLYAKDMIPNAITSTCFKKYFHENLNERRDKEEFSSFVYYLPSTTNRKEKIN